MGDVKCLKRGTNEMNGGKMYEKKVIIFFQRIRQCNNATHNNEVVTNITNIIIYYLFTENVMCIPNWDFYEYKNIHLFLQPTIVYILKENLKKCFLSR